MAYTPSEFQVKVLANICRGIDSMYKDGLLCDLKVTVGHVTFDCHSLVLAAVSGFFQALVTSSWRESQNRQVTIEHEDVTAESFQMLLDILYKAKEVITKETAKDVLRMSIYLQVKFLEEHCEGYLEKNITPDVCVGTWLFAEKYSLPTLAQTAAAMASDEIDQVVKSDEFPQLPKAMLLIILGSQRKLSMDDLCRTILRWVEKEPESRQAHLGELLPFVSFPQLSPVYISELMNYYFDHPFRKYMAKNIKDAVSFNLFNQNEDLKRQILARQDRVSSSPHIHKCVVVVGGCTENNTILDELSAFRVEPGRHFGTYPLKPFPESCGIHFASCVWENELYVSGGSQKGTFFAKYKPGFNDWEVLPDMTRGFKKHAMAAVNGNVYVIGGFGQKKKHAPSLIQVYDVSKKCWSQLENQLPVAVQDAATAVLGHRVYVFGGKDVSNQPSDVVQCLDSTSGFSYEAGKLPFPTGEIVALSDGGTIYLMCDGTKVLKMKELFDVADKKERQAKELQKAEKKTVASTEKQASVTKQELSFSVSFTEVGAFADVRMLSAFLHNGEMVACGAGSPGGALLPDLKGMNLAFGVVSSKRQQLPQRMKNFAIQTLNIPQAFVEQEKLIGQFQVGDQVRLKPGVLPPYTNVTVGTVQGIEPDGQVTVSFLYQGQQQPRKFYLNIEQNVNYTTAAKNLCLQ